MPVKRFPRRVFRLFAIAVSVVAFGGVGQAALTHRYSFNDGTANDSVGAANGLAVNGPTFAGGQVVFNPAVNNGTNTSPATGQYIDLPNNIARSRALTLEAWTTYRGGGNWQRIADFGNNSSGSEIQPTDKTTVGYFGVGYTIFTPQNANGRILGQISINSSGATADTDFTQGSSGVTPNAQHHLVLTHDPDGGFQRIYYDGVQVGQSVAEVDPSTTNYLNSWLGRSNFHQDPFYNGTINEFRIYDNALPADAVRFNTAQGPDGAVAVPEPAGALLLAVGVSLLLRRVRRGR